MSVIAPSTLSGSRVLVTGGAGFIGSHLVDALVRQGARVRVLDNLSTGHRENLAAARQQVELVEEDIRDLAACQRAAAGVDWILHQAALGSVPRSLKSPAESLAVNVNGTANVFTAARDQGVRRVVYASSSSVYGDSERVPKREGEEGAPLSPYALSKRINEQLADLFVRCYGLALVGLRYFNVYGPRQDPEGPYAAVIPRFFAGCRAGRAPTIFGDGRQSRDFTYVGDIVEANLCALLGTAGQGQAFNVGAGVETTIGDLAVAIARAAGVAESPSYEAARPGDVLHSVADSSRIAATFGWRATTTVAAGIALCSEFYR
jgi:nucleoside-diphosphate-sugar epimerase